MRNTLEEARKAAAAKLADLYTKHGETDAGVLARAAADAAIQIVVMDLHSTLYPEQWPKAVNSDHIYWTQDRAGEEGVVFEWDAGIGEWMGEQLTALLEQVGKPDLDQELQAYRRNRIDELVKEYGRAELLNDVVPGEYEYVPRWALMEADSGPADNGGPWWRLGDDWRDLLKESATQEFPEDWPAERIFDLDSKFSSGVQVRYEATNLIDPDPFLAGRRE